MSKFVVVVVGGPTHYHVTPNLYLRLDWAVTKYMHMMEESGAAWG